MVLPNTVGYELISPERLKELSEQEPHACVLKKAIHEPNCIPAILIDWDDGRKEFFTIETAQQAKDL